MAFVKYYLQALDYAWSVGDPKVLDGLATPECSLCTNVRTTAQESADKGLKSTGQVLKPGKVELASRTARFLLVLCDLDLQKVAYADPAGKIVDPQAPKTLEWAAQVVWRGGWKVQTIGSR